MRSWSHAAAVRNIICRAVSHASPAAQQNQSKLCSLQSARGRKSLVSSPQRAKKLLRIRPQGLLSTSEQLLTALAREQLSVSQEKLQLAISLLDKVYLGRKIVAKLLFDNYRQAESIASITTKLRKLLLAINSQDLFKFLT